MLIIYSGFFYLTENSDVANDSVDNIDTDESAPKRMKVKRSLARPYTIIGLILTKMESKIDFLDFLILVVGTLIDVDDTNHSSNHSRDPRISNYSLQQQQQQ
jgi:hypothetical protein